MALSANSQTSVIINEDFEAGELPSGWLLDDLDGDGHNWEYVSIFDGHESEKCFSSASWKHDGIGALTPDNWLETPLLELSEVRTLSFWVCAQDKDYAAEHYAVYYSLDGTVYQAALVEETLTGKGFANKRDAIDAANAKGSVERGRVQGAWYYKTASIPAGAKRIGFRHFNSTDQFWINLDDVIIEAIGGGGPSDDVELPYFEDFSEGEIPSNWKNIDQDGDGNKWVTTYSDSNPINVAMSASWLGGNTLFPDNWLITPMISGVRSVKYDVAAANLNDYAENYSILISDTTADISAFQEIFSETLTAEDGNEDILVALENMKPRGINIPDGTKYIAFRHHDCSDQFWLMLDNMLFDNKEITSVSGVEAEKVNIYSQDGKLFINTSIEGSVIEVYSTDGRLAAKAHSQAGSNEFALASGNYVVKVGAFTGKVSVK